MRIDQRWPEDGSEMVYWYFPRPLGQETKNSLEKIRPLRVGWCPIPRLEQVVYYC